MRLKKDIGEIFREGTAIDEALREGFRIAAWKHKQLGVPMAIWKDEQVVMVPPEEIIVPAGR